jgi:membrane protease YdiL (CAAX protease family)
LQPAENASTESSSQPLPAWPVFVGFVVVLVALNVLSALVMGIGVGREVIRGTVDAAHLNTELVGSLLHELARRPVLASITFVLTSAVFAGYALIAGAKAREGLAMRLRLQPSTVAATLFATAALFSMSELLDMLVESQGWLKHSHSLVQIRSVLWQMDGRWLSAALVIFALLPGLGEELFFRGFVQSRLSRRWGSTWAVLFAALLFGIAHGDPVHSPLAFVMGLTLGAVVEWTGSLWPAIAAHVVNNALSVLETLGYVQFHLPDRWKVGALATLLATGLILLWSESDRRQELSPGN